MAWNRIYELVDKNLSPDDFRRYVEGVQSCGDHPIPELTDEVLHSVVEVVGGYDVVGDEYYGVDVYIVVKLANGKYGQFSEWTDYSGHGCQCSAGWAVYDTEEEAQK